jgi:hypothetical protein
VTATARHKLQLTVLAGPFVICRFDADEPLPVDANAHAGLLSVTRTATELSVVCAAEVLPAARQRETGWRCLGVRGPLSFSQTGILASLATPLADAGIAIFALSTFDTDYLLVRGQDLERAVATLRAAGHEVEAPAE